MKPMCKWKGVGRFKHGEWVERGGRVAEVNAICNSHKDISYLIEIIKKQKMFKKSLNRNTVSCMGGQDYSQELYRLFNKNPSVEGGLLLMSCYGGF